MPYAFIAQVQFLEGGDPAIGQKLLDSEVVPLASSQTGFQRGAWFRNIDGTTGIGTAVYDTEANAAAAGEAVRSQVRPAGSPTIVAAGIYEVVAEA